MMIYVHTKQESKRDLEVEERETKDENSTLFKRIDKIKSFESSSLLKQS